MFKIIWICFSIAILQRYLLFMEHVFCRSCISPVIGETGHLAPSSTELKSAGTVSPFYFLYFNSSLWKRIFVQGASSRKLQAIPKRDAYCDILRPTIFISWHLVTEFWPLSASITSSLVIPAYVKGWAVIAAEYGIVDFWFLEEGIMRIKTTAELTHH